MALTNTSLPNHLSIYSPPDFVSGPHLDEKKGALADPSPVVTEIREKPSFESSLRTAANSKHRQSTLSTTSTRLGRGSFLNFAALARDKTNDAIASLSGPVLRSRTSGTFTNEQINTTISGRPRESYIGQRRSVLPSPKSSAQNLRESVQPIASQHGREQSAYTLPAIDIDTPHHDMHQTSSRLLRMTDDERPFTKDFKDLFSTLIVSLPLESHRRFLTKADHSFLSEEAINNLGSLKFSQSNRMPDPKDPSRIVTTTTTTTFSMAKDMARSVCQRFVDARLIESVDGKQQKEFAMKGALWHLTPKGIFVLNRFCQRNGIQQKHVQELVNNPAKNTTQLVILERDGDTDAISLDKGTIEVIFRRFIGIGGPNIKTSITAADSDSLSEYKDGLQGVRMAHERKVGSPQRTVYETFTGKAAIDWLMDCCMTVDKLETIKLATAFVEHELIWCVHQDRSYSAMYPTQKFQPTKSSFWQMTQKGKDVVSLAYQTRNSGDQDALPSSRVGASKDSNTQKLDRILVDPALRLLFREQLRDTHCEENLSFYLDVDGFLKTCKLTLKNITSINAKEKKAAKDMERMYDNVKEIMASAYGIYNAFLAPGSPCELNIDHMLRQQLAQRMTKSVGQKDAMIDSLKEVIALFEQAQLSVFKLMASDSVPKFMKSSKYEQTLKFYDFDSSAASPSGNGAAGVSRSSSSR